MVSVPEWRIEVVNARRGSPQRCLRRPKARPASNRCVLPTQVCFSSSWEHHLLCFAVSNWGFWIADVTENRRVTRRNCIDVDTKRGCFSQVEQDGRENRPQQAALSRDATLLKEASLNLSCVSGFSLALLQLHSAVQHIKSLETEALK